MCPVFTWLYMAVNIATLQQQNLNPDVVRARNPALGVSDQSSGEPCN